MYAGKIVFAQVIDHLPVHSLAPLRPPLRRRSQAAKLLLPRSVSVHGLRAADLSREPARHRGLPARPAHQALPHGHPRARTARATLLLTPTRGATGAFPCRLQPIALIRIARPLYAQDRTSEHRARPHRLCPRLDHHRPLPRGLPLGPVPAHQGRRSRLVTPSWICAAISQLSSISATADGPT